MDNQLQTLAFISLFHIIGGVAVGRTVRGWLRGGFACNSLFMIVWGGMFGIVPLTLGYETFVRSGAVPLFGAEVAVLLAAFLGALFVPDWFLESFDAQTVAPIAMGGIFLLVGVGAGVAIFASDPVMALLFGGLFAGIGGAVFVWGLVRVLKA